MEEPQVINRVEDLFNTVIYYVEIKPHKALNGLIALNEEELYPVVFYGFTKVHTVPNRLFIRVDAENACKTSFLQSRFPLNGYNTWWRCWSLKPTNEQRLTTKWH